MTPEENRLVEHALNLVRLKRFGVYTDGKGNICYVNQNDSQQHIDDVQRKLELEAENELLLRSLEERREDGEDTRDS